jgi:hypothetical protein
MAASFAVLKDRIVFLYGQSDQPHTTVDMKIDIGTATLRLDGFAAMSAGDTPGHITTKPLGFEEGELWVNAQAASGGHLKAEILDAEGRPMVGYAEEDCTAFEGDSVGMPLSWRDKRTIPANSRIRFLLRNARLYAFRVKR